MEQEFGGSWTEEKLTRVKAYLEAYGNVMKNQLHFTTTYINAFAGTGAVRIQRDDEISSSLLAEQTEEEQETGKIIQGSADVALEVKPGFDEYVFIEKSNWRYEELKQLRAKHYNSSRSIQFLKGDANTVIREICTNWDWQKRRSVLFLDPFGMSVEWDTLKAVAATEAIDLWYLFPLMAVNRHLRKGGDVSADERMRLDRLFGDTNWESQFYVRRSHPTLFDEVEETRDKYASTEMIRDYFVSRLKSIFPARRR